MEVAPLSERQTVEPAQGLGRQALLGFVLSVALYLFTMLGFPSNYTYTRADFLQKYAHGIFRYRFLTREIILGLANLLGTVGLHTVATPRGRLFTSFLIVGGASIGTLGTVLYRSSVARDQRMFGPYVLLLAILVLAGYTVTPYDYPSFLFIALTCVLAFGEHPRSPILCAVSAIIATCIRESSFLIAAAAAGTALAEARPRDVSTLLAILRGRSRGSLLWRNTLSVALACGATYVAIHVALANPADRGGLTGPGLPYNLHSSSSWSGVAMAALAIAVLAGVYRYTGVATGGGLARRLLWALSVPYILIFLVGGIWFETPRLIAPILVAEFLLVTPRISSGPPPDRGAAPTAPAG